MSSPVPNQRNDVISIEILSEIAHSLPLTRGETREDHVMNSADSSIARRQVGCRSQASHPPSVTLIKILGRFNRGFGHPATSG